MCVKPPVNRASKFQIGMCRIPDIYPISGPDTGHFYSSGKLRRVDSVKIKFAFSIYVRNFEASMKT